MENKLAELLADLKKLKNASEVILYDIAEKENLTMIEINIIGFLTANPNYNTAREIEALCMIKKSNISTAIDDLIHREYITREVDKFDRRIIRLNPTGKGQLIGNVICEKRAELVKKLFDGLSFEEIEIFFNINRKIISNIGKLN